MPKLNAKVICIGWKEFLNVTSIVTPFDQLLYSHDMKQNLPLIKIQLLVNLYSQNVKY